jgi:spermidine/putrescine transport system substrate-binding protein
MTHQTFSTPGAGGCVGSPSLSRRSLLAALGAITAGITLQPRHAWSAAEEKQLNFYNWDTYIGETTLIDFKKASGIEVKMDLYADNDELFAKLKAGNPGYDVVVPSHDFVERMIKAGMLMPLDHAMLPNKVNIEPVVQEATFDPGRAYRMPSTRGSIGIGYRTSAVDSVPDSWKWLYGSDTYSGRIALLGDGATVIELGLKYLGHSLNTTDTALIKQVEQMVIKQKPHIKVFAKDNGQDLLLSGEVDLAMESNGDILQVISEDDDISYVVPKEGTALWQDCLCIPKGAPHPRNAHQFINYILTADVSAAIAKTIQYATPNTAAKAKMPEAYRHNPAIFPPPDVMKHSEISAYLGEALKRVIDETWTRIQAA